MVMGMNEERTEVPINAVPVNMDPSFRVRDFPGVRFVLGGFDGIIE
jgi:hypothetical protein